MAENKQLPRKLLEQIGLRFSKTPKQVLFEEIAEKIQRSNKDLSEDDLIEVVEAIVQEEPHPYSTEDGEAPPQRALVIGDIINMEDDDTRRKATHGMVTLFWNTLDHPPTSYVGDKYQYRQPDGSYNNIMNPDLGKAGSRYARTVRPALALPADRPDPELLFDLLMARGDNFTPNAAGFSGLFYCHAAIITHDIFNTDRTDTSINKASSYLDLSPLYGSSEADQKLIRTFEDGEIKPDTFFDTRVLGLPPVVSVMLIMYSRFHNYAARTLAAINEGGRFTLQPNIGSEEAQKKRDNDLFQVARLVTNGLYVTICVNDYVRAIFNVNNSLSNWSLDPQAEITTVDGHSLPRGVGNQVSCEFNLLYRFHSALSKGDATWTAGLFSKIFDGKDISKLTLAEFRAGIGKYEERINREKPWERTFGGLVRQDGGTFKDEDLVKILKEVIEDPAGAFGTNHVPDVLKHIEIMGILQARSWQVATLNEFRRFIGQPPHKDFKSMNPDEYVAGTLKTLYSHVDNVEMYPGLFLERTVPIEEPWSGIRSPITVANAVLADAVSLIRGDRHMTQDYTPIALTNWGINEVASDPQTLGGAKIHHLILRAFPNHFQFNSVYAMQPFYTPERSLEIFKHFKIDGLFSFDQPALLRQPIPVIAHAAVVRILEDQVNFKVPWAESGFLLTYMLSGDSPAHTAQRELVKTTLQPNDGAAIQQFTEFSKLITLSLLKRGARQLGRESVYHIDIIKDFGNLVALQFASVLCYLPLNFEFGTGGTYSEAELYGVFTKLIEYIFYNTDPTRTWALRRDLSGAVQKLTTNIEQKIQELAEPSTSSSTPLKCPVTGALSGEDDTASAIRAYGANFTKQILNSGTKLKETAEILIGNGIAIIGTVGLVFGQIIDFYLQSNNAEYWTHIIELSKENTTEADDKLIKYILEGTRLSGALGSVRNVDPADGKPIELEIHPGRKVYLNKGDRVVTSFAHASRDPTVFPNPDKVDLGRPLDLYVAFGFGPHKCLGRNIGTACLLTMLKTVAVLKNLRRMPGDQGRLRFVNRPGGGSPYMTPDCTEFTAFPTTMRLLFDQPSK